MRRFINMDFNGTQWWVEYNEDGIDKKEYFIPELKKIDYLIKISDININIQEFIKKLNQINTTSTAIIDVNKIKQKKHFNVIG
jgi:hypothetical protein